MSSVGCGSDANKPPVASAGADQVVDAGAQVTIDGSASRDPEGHALTFVWRQLNGPAVALSSEKSQVASFTSPMDATTLTFQLSVSDGTDASIATTHVTVRSSEPSASVTELSQGIPVQTATRPGVPKTWLVPTPDLPVLPDDESESAEFTESYEEHSVLFLPVVERQLAAGAMHSITLPLTRASGLSAYAQWIGTTELLKSTIDLDGAVLAKGVPYAIGSDRGGTLIQVLAPADGLATFTITNTTSAPIQVRMALASSAP
jgi:hypothetical protein